MQHPRLAGWERTLRRLFDRIDDALEDRYGRTYALHPARPPRGGTASKAHDGLFNVGAAFSAGFGSEHGPGYVVEVRLSTLEDVPADVRRQIEDEVAERLRSGLAEAFPGRELHVDRDGRVYKIHGDLSLGDV
jgi:hypothetical protein